MSILAQAVVRISADIGDLEAGLQLAEEAVGKAGHTFESAGKKLSLFVTAPLVGLGTLAFKEFGEAEDAMARLEGVISSTGGVAGVTAEHIHALAESLQQQTTFSHDATEAASAVLLTFQSVRNEVGKGNDIFDRAVKSSQGLAEIMGGDLQGAMRRLGLALEDPAAGLTLLRRTGVAFSQEEQEQIKSLQEHGQTLEAQRMILDKVESKFKDVAQAMARTPLGQMKQAWNAVKDALESVGKVLAPIAIAGAHAIKFLAEEFQKLSDTTKGIGVAIGAFAAAIGPVLLAIASVQKAVAFVRAGVTLMGTTIGTVVGMSALWLAAIIAVVNTTRLLVQNWTWFKSQALALWTAIGDAVFTAEEFILKVLSKIPFLGKFFKGALSDIEAAHEEFLASAGRKFSEYSETLRQELLAAGDEANNTAGVIHHAAQKAGAAPWAGDAKKALAELSNSLRAADEMAKLLGPTFDLAGARADAYKTAVDALTTAHVPMNAALDQTGVTLQTLANRWQAAITASEQFKAVVEATTTLADSLSVVGQRSALLGREYDVVAAQADAYKTALDALTAAHWDAAKPIPGLGITLDQLAEKYRVLVSTQQLTQDSQNAFNDAVSNAKSIVDSARTPQEQYNHDLADLQFAYHMGKIGADELAAAQAYLQQQLKNSDDISVQLKQTLIDMVGRASDQVVEFAFTGKQAFGDFVRSALEDLAKLILKLELTKLLTNALGLGGPNISGHAHGGFIQPGSLGLVGEQGPELVAAGRSGLSVKPLHGSDMVAAGGGGGDTVHMTFQIQAVDAQGVAQFVENSQAMISNAVLKSFQRSRLLRNRMGG